MKRKSFSRAYLAKEREEYAGGGEGAAAHEKLETRKKELAERKALMGKKKAIKQYKDTLNKPGSMRNTAFASNRNANAQARINYARGDMNAFGDYTNGRMP